MTTAGGSLAGYTAAEASTYVWLGQALLAPIALLRLVRARRPGQDRRHRRRPGAAGGPAAVLVGTRPGPGRLRAAGPRAAAAADRGAHHRRRAAGLLDRLPARSAQPGRRGLDQLHAALPAQPARLLGARHPRLRRASTSCSSGRSAASTCRSTCSRAGCRRSRTRPRSRRCSRSPIDVLSGRVLGRDAVAVWPIQLVWLVVVVAARPARAGRATRAPGGAGWLRRRRRRRPVGPARLPRAARLPGPQPSSPTGSSFAVDVPQRGRDRRDRVRRDLRPARRTCPCSAGSTWPRPRWSSPWPTSGFALADLSSASSTRSPPCCGSASSRRCWSGPMPLMVQLVTSDFQLRRLGRALVGVVHARGGAARWLDVDWTAARCTCCWSPRSPAARSTARCSPLAGGIQFWLVDGAEFTSSFVYGGGYAGQVPGSVLLTGPRTLFTFVVPATVTGYLPALLILGLPGPAVAAGLAGLVRRRSFAAWAWLLAGLAWRSGLRQFTGAGWLTWSSTDHRARTSLRRTVRGAREGRPAAPRGAAPCTRSTASACASTRARPSATSAPTAPASRRPSRCSPASWCRRRAGSAPADSTRSRSGGGWPAEIGVVFGQRSQLWWDLPLRDSFRILAAIHRLTGRRRGCPHPATWSTAGARRASWTPRSGSSRWGSGCGVRWRRPWCTDRGCWCWTSPRSGWT